MRTVAGLTLLGISLALLVSQLAALADPRAGLRMDDAADVFVATSPWYVHAGRLAVIALMGWVSLRLLNCGAPDRPVSARGFTPAEQ